MMHCDVLPHVKNIYLLDDYYFVICEIYKGLSDNELLMKPLSRGEKQMNYQTLELHCTTTHNHFKEAISQDVVSFTY